MRSSYPLVYSVLILPLSIVRWSFFGGQAVPSAATFIVFFLYCLSGAMNVTLLLFTRPKLLLFGPIERISPLRGRALSFSLARKGAATDESPSHQTMQLGHLSDDSTTDWDVPKRGTVGSPSYDTSGVP